MLPALVIFDWDDTLVDSYGAIHAAINTTREAFGLAAWSIEQARRECRYAVKEIFPLWFGEAWEQAQVIFYESIAQHHLIRLRKKEGADSLLATFAEYACPVAVNSNKRGDFLRAEIKHLGWQDQIGCVIGAGDVLHGKPAPDGIQAILAHFELMPSQNIWFIGDNDVDEATARAGGCLPIIVNKDAPRSSTWHFATLMDIADTLKQLVSA